MVRAWCALYILTSTCASRHNSVHFFDISTSKSGPNVKCFSFFTCKCVLHHNGVHFSTSQLPSMVCFARFDLEMCFAPQRRAIFRPAGRFSEPSFRPSGASNQWKNTVFRDFPTFSRAWIFFLLTLSLLRSSLCCSSLLFFDSYHLCFSSVHTVGSLTSKLPSIIYD